MGLLSKRFLLALFCLAIAVSVCGAFTQEQQQQHQDGASSTFKFWMNWAQSKLPGSPIPGARSTTPSTDTHKAQDASKSWSSWAFDKLNSFTGRASKDAGETKEYGKEKLQEGHRAASDASNDAKEKVSHASKDAAEKATSAKGSVIDSATESKVKAEKKKKEAEHKVGEATEAAKGKAEEGGEKAKSYTGKTAEHAGKAAESLKDNILEKAEKGYETLKSYAGHASDKAHHEFHATQEAEL